MKKKYTIILKLLLWSYILLSLGGIQVGLFAQNEPNFAWVKRIGNNSAATSNVQGPVMAIDSVGNSYLAGVFFNQSYTLDGITIPLPAGTSSGGYIAKYNPDGQIIWAKPIGNLLIHTSTNTEYNTNKILLDKQGNIYLCGENITDAASVINDYYITPNQGGSTIGHYRAHFLAKLDANGEVLWVKTTDHPSYSMEGATALARTTNEIHFDLDGNINMTGGFKDYITFSPDDTLNTNTDEAAVYITKYNPEGEVMSAKKLEGAYPWAHYYSEHVRTDASGNLYRWSNRAGHNSRKLYRYDAQGEPLDTLTLNASTPSMYGYYLQGFTVSPIGDVFIAGGFLESLTVEGTTYTAFDNLRTDAIVFKLAAPTYEIEWVNTYNSSNSDIFENLLTDDLGNLYVVGRKNDAGQGRMLLQKYDGSGVLLWEKIVESLYNADTPYFGGISPSVLCQANNGGNIWISGNFRRNTYFEEGYHFTTPNLSHSNGFLLQYGLCEVTNPVIEAPNSTQLCEGESLVLSAELTDTDLTYFWSTPTGIVTITATNTTTLTVTQPGKYYLIAQSDTECYGKSQEVWVTQLAVPNNEIIQDEQTLTATENTENTTYQWLDCDNNNYPIEGATEQSFTPLVSGNYAVEVTNASGCSVVSECQEVSVMSIKDIEKTAIVLYPNPATTTLFLETSHSIKRISIINMEGKTVLKSKNSNEVDVSALAQGYYVIIAKTDLGTWKGKFVKR